MPVRSGMTKIILELRRMTDTSDGEVTVNGVSYWSDQQLQDILDQHRLDVLDVELVSKPLQTNGVTEWKRYYIPDGVGRFIEYDSAVPDTSIFDIVNSLGVSAAGYTVDLLSKSIVFTANTGGITYFLRGRTYLIYGSAAQVWFEKAGHRTALINWTAGLQQLEEDLEYQHCMAMYKEYNSRGGLRSVVLTKRGYALGPSNRFI